MNVLHYLDWLKHFASLLPWIGLAMLLFVIALIILGQIHRFISFRKLFRQKVIFLELTPPANTNQTPEATDELYMILHGLGMRRVLPDKVRGRITTYSLETVSTRSEGIRFVIRINKRDAATVESNLNSYLPEVRVKRIKDYLPLLKQQSFTRILSYKQAIHYSNPLANHTSLEKKDPLAYLLGAMTKLEESEIIATQVVITPVRVREAIILSGQVMHNEDIQSQLQGNRFSSFGKAMHMLSSILMKLTDLVREIQDHGQSSGQNYNFNRDIYERQQASQGIRPARTLTTIQQEQALAQHNKLSQPLFYTEIRILVKMNDSTRLSSRIDSIESALESYSVPSRQSLRLHSVWISKLFKKYAQRAFIKRMPSFFNGRSSLLAASEISSLYHFPHSITANTENVIKSSSKTLPATVSLKNGSKLDVVLGMNKYHGSDTAIGLTAAERERHVYIIGGTGNGKTTMLEYSIMQDIQNGKGVAIIDPHGDSAQKLLRYIPKNRLDDVIYLNPRDLDFPIGLNLLELPEGLTGSDLAHEKDMVTEAVISVLRKIFDDNTDSGAYRIERVLRNTIHTAFSVKDATLFTVLRILTDASYRKKVAKTLTDESLKRFWKEELGKAGEMQRVKISGGPITRIERFERSESAKRILGQTKSTIDFDDILNSSKILICNFSKGRLGEDTSTLFGTTILAKLQLAAWRRDGIPERDRVPFYLYVDEFQNFASESFLSLFSEARKYKMFITMAQQSVSQLESQSTVNTILDNVGTIIGFRSKSAATEQLLLHQLSPQIVPGEIGNLPTFNFYIKIAALQAQEPMSGETLLLKDAGSERMAEAVIKSSRKLYATIYELPGTPENDKTPSTEPDPSDDVPVQDEPAPA